MFVCGHDVIGGDTLLTENAAVLQTIVHYGWVPLILFVGWSSSSPKPNLIKSVHL